MKCKSKIFAPPPSDGFLIVTSRATRCRVLADNTKLFERGEGEASSDGANVQIGFRSRRKPPAPLSLQELNDTRTGRVLMFAVYIQMWHIPSQTHAISCRRMVSCPLQQLGYSYIHGFLHDRPKPWLIVGLGNPGQKFEGTRHNVGFEMIDSISQTEGISINTTLCKALCGKGHIGNTPVLLAKPQTFMDLSGESVGPLTAYYKIPIHHVLLMFDDMELPCGILRLNQNGGHGGHNGVKSVMQAFKKIQDFARLRIGIGKPPGNMDPKAYLLQTYNSSARETVNIALKEGVEAARLLTSEGFFESARHFNLKQKYKHQKVDYLGFGRKNC